LQLYINAKREYYNQIFYSINDLFCYEPSMFPLG